MHYVLCFSKFLHFDFVRRLDLCTFLKKYLTRLQIPGWFNDEFFVHNIISFEMRIGLQLHCELLEINEFAGTNTIGIIADFTKQSIDNKLSIKENPADEPSSISEVPPKKKSKLQVCIELISNFDE